LFLNFEQKEPRVLIKLFLQKISVLFFMYTETTPYALYEQNQSHTVA